MHIVVKNIVDVKTAQPEHGKYLARQARGCFVNDQTLTFDFEGLQFTSQEFFQEFFLPLVAEYGAEFVNNHLIVVNVNEMNTAVMKMAFNNLDAYFERLLTIPNPACDSDIYDMNLAWLVKARELACQNAAQAELIMGITEEELRLAISQLTMEDMQHIAQSGWLCFAPRFNSKFINCLIKGKHEIVDVLLGLSGSCF